MRLSLDGCCPFKCHNTTEVTTIADDPDVPAILREDAGNAPAATEVTPAETSTLQPQEEQPSEGGALPAVVDVEEEAGPGIQQSQGELSLASAAAPAKCNLDSYSMIAPRPRASFRTKMASCPDD